MNKTMKKINILLAALVILFTASCQGFLDVKPSNQVSSEISIQNATDAQIMLNGLMNKMTSTSYYGRNFPMYADAKGGDLTIFSAGNGGDGWYYFNHSPESNSYSGYWSTIYNCLYQANNIIANIDVLLADPENTEKEELNNFKAQALTLRALMHFDLVRLYGKPYNMDKGSLGVTVVTEPVDARAQLTRNTVEEVYTQVVKDLNDAAPLFESKDKNGGFADYYANRAILAKVYMYMDNFSEALKLFEEIISSGKYELYKNDKWVESWTKEYGSESIFELHINATDNDPGDSGLGAYYRRRAHGISAGGVFLASKYWLDLMGPNDVRWGIMDYDQSHAEDNTGRKGANYKYSGSTDLKGDEGSTSTSVNIKVIRLSEVYLNAAECAARTNANAKALEYLGAIAKRNPDWVAPATVTPELVQDERRRELMCEGVVFFEYMRQNMTVKYDDNAFGNSTNPPHEGRGQLANGWVTRDFYKTILPISQGEINANPDIEQNPEY
jgi:tetratricopeptide (TPR) repeat protein